MPRLGALVVLGCAAALSACNAGPIGRQHAYHLGNPQVLQRGSLTLALAVQDQRPYVLSGAKRPNFSGLSRGGFGNPFDVTTLSGQGLWADFAISIRRGLKKAGYSVTSVDISDRASLAQVRSALLQAGAQRGLAVQIREWKSDTATNTSIHYGLTLVVFDAAGQEIGRAAIDGREALGGNFIDPGAVAEKAVPEAHARKLEQLLNATAIRRALAAPAAPPAQPPDAAPAPPAAPVVTPAPPPT